MEGERPAEGSHAAEEAAGKERRTAPRRGALRLQTAQPPQHSPRRCALRARMEDTTQAPCVVGPGVLAPTLELPLQYLFSFGPRWGGNAKKTIFFQ